MKYKPGDTIVIFNKTSSDVAIIDEIYKQDKVYYYLYRYINNDYIYCTGVYHIDAISVFEITHIRKQKLQKICSSQEIY